MVYIINRTGSNLYKVGHSNNIERRMKELQTANAEKLILIESWQGGRELEKKIHDKFRPEIKGRQLSKAGEWFEISRDWLRVLLFEIRTKMV